MSRKTMNLIVDAVAFGCFVLLTTSGVLVHYVLPPGSGHSRSVWGLDRHDWGTAHFWIAAVFLGALAVHFFLHWRWIVSVLKGVPREASGSRAALGIIGVIALLALAGAPLVSPVERIGERMGRGEHSRLGQSNGGRIRGSMTLREVERSTGVPVEYLVGKLGLPPGIEPEERLGRLGSAHGFSMDDVRRILDAYTETVD